MLDRGRGSLSGWTLKGEKNLPCQYRGERSRLMGLHTEALGREQPTGSRNPKRTLPGTVIGRGPPERGHEAGEP